MTPVTRELRVGGVCAFEAEPVLADGILRIVACEVFTRHRVCPLRVEQLRTNTHLKVAGRRAVRRAKTAWERGEHDALVARTDADIHTVISLRNNGAERSLWKFQSLANANRFGLLDVVDALDQSPVAADFVASHDLLKAVTRLHRVLEEHRVIRVVDRREGEHAADFDKRV